MGAGYDGSIKINTKIDNKNLSSGIAKTDKAIKSLGRSVTSNIDGAGFDKLNSKVLKATENVHKQEAVVKELQDKYDKLISADGSSKGLETMEKELKKTETGIDKATEKFNKLLAEQTDIQSKTITVNGQEFMPPGSEERLQAIDSEMETLGTKIRNDEASATALRNKLAEIKASPQASEEAGKLSTQISLANEKLIRLKVEESEAAKKAEELGDKGSKAAKKTASGASSSANAFEKFGKRVGGLVKRVFVFSVITKALRALRTALGGLFTNNSTISSYLAQIKGNLLAAFAPIYYYVLPAIQTLLQFLAYATQQIAAFIGNIFGKSLGQTKQLAKTMYASANATKADTEATEENNEAKDNQVASFDHLNDISKSDTPSSSASTTPSASSTEGNTPDFGTSEISGEQKQKFDKVLKIVKAIGAAIALWKLGGFIKTLKDSVLPALQKFKGKASEIGKSLSFKQFAGIALVIVGIIGYFSSLKDIIDGNNDGATTFKVIIFTIITAVGLLLLGVSWWIVLIVAAVMGLVALFVDLWNNVKGFKEAVIQAWEGIKEMFSGVWDFIKGLFTGDKELMEDAKKRIKAGWEKFKKGAGKAIKLAWQRLKDKMKELVDWIKQKIPAPILKTMSNMWKKLKYGGAMFFYGLKVGFISVLNFLTNGINNLVKGILAPINLIIKGINAISKDEKIPELSFAIPKIALPEKPAMPKLATGAVIPPGAEFAAILGDQRRGRNLEAPESLIRQIVKEESNSMSIDDIKYAFLSALVLAKQQGILDLSCNLDGKKVSKQISKPVGDELNRSGFVLRTAKG